MTNHSHTYLKYIKSHRWRERRLAKLEQAKFRCERCSDKNDLTVHHKTYARLGNERSDDLVVLCPTCHLDADIMRESHKPLTKEFFQKVVSLARGKHVEHCPDCKCILIKSSYEGYLFCPECQSSFRAGRLLHKVKR